ncbi:TBC domain-containing [Cryptosporidium sp. chipmunk genotype I]|uniref:TBC domain-containing n=1 Tax=Cryptosporidium sp. chipmunk genotype I TaxID=1280935 RepID=UPI00351A57DC|nr:TBC domain-containing [Cryptosporidium sp. chipmunk genotype I]
MIRKRKKDKSSETVDKLCLAELELKIKENESIEKIKLVEIQQGEKYGSNRKTNQLRDGFIRNLLISHNNRSVLNTGLFVFLDEDDIKEASLVCKLWLAEANSIKTLQERYPIQLNRFSKNQRKWIWKCILIGEDKYQLCIEDEKKIEEIRLKKETKDEFGLSCESQLDTMLNYHDEILRDISRTFPKLKEFQIYENQNKMVEILFKISYALPNVGYCQGMNYLVGIFLYALDFNVEQVYSSVMSILINWEYQEIYNKGLIKLREMCFVFNELIKEYLPEIYNNIFNNKENEIEITPELFAIQWFLTLFTYDIADTEYAINSILILDNIIIHDPSRNFNITVYKIALSLLRIIFKDYKFEKFNLNTHILEFVRIRSKEILMNINEIDTLLNMSRDLKVPEFIIQKMYIKYKNLELNRDFNTINGGFEDRNEINIEKESQRSNIVNIFNHSKFKEFSSSSLLKRYTVISRFEDLDEFPSSFHPYFNI